MRVGILEDGGTVHGVDFSCTNNAWLILRVSREVLSAGCDVTKNKIGASKWVHVRSNARESHGHRALSMIGKGVHRTRMSCNVV